jgi:poly(3-hydroxybutyrate) depolymerase
MKLLLALALIPSLSFAGALPALKIDEVSISGVSSGAFMAVQMGVAYSKTITGVGSIAGGIYWCAEGNSRRAQTTCMNQPAGITPQTQIDKAKSLAAEGAIDPIENMARQKIYVYASPKDSIIYPVNSDKLVEFYKGAGDPSSLRLEKSIPSGHGFPTVDRGNACNLAMPPWINKCNYDAAGEMLRAFHGELKARGSMVAANLKKFSQAEFGNASTPLFTDGWVYVPSACASGESCRLHVALHGCLMNPEFIQDKFVTMAGYNEWAETNRIVVLYPQSGKLGQANPYACWDWFGFTGQNYVTQSGAQMSALKKMIDQISGR